MCRLYPTLRSRTLNYKERKAALLERLRENGVGTLRGMKKHTAHKNHEIMREASAQQIMENLKNDRNVTHGFDSPSKFRAGAQLWLERGWIVSDFIAGPRCADHDRLCCKHRGCVWSW